MQSVEEGRERPELVGRPAFARSVVVSLATLVLVLHLAVNLVSPYGFHRDEFLYFAMGRHLRLWRMDFPPGIALVAEAVRATLGDSLVALRLVPALIGTLLVVLAALVAREMGGGRRAQALAALGVLAHPVFLRAANLFQPVIFDQLAWTATLYALARLCRSDDRRWWLGVGAALGLGLLVKFSAAFLGAALLIALLVTPERRWLATPWPWAAAALALAVGSPSFIGQLRLGWPVLDQLGDLRASQLARVTPIEYVIEQLRWGPATLLGLAGAVALLRAEWARPFRVVGWSCVGAFALLMALHGKAYYIGPVYPTLLGAAGVLLERVRRPRVGAALRWSAVGALICYMLLILPIGLPFLPPDRMARYIRAIGATESLRTNTGELERLPQDYADMLGWEQQTEAVAMAWAGLTPEERASAVIVAGNYGEAGALDFYGPRRGLPPVVSPAGSYWFFGPGWKPGAVVVTIGAPRGALAPLFGEVREAGRVSSPWSVREERELTIYVASRPHRTLQEVWPSLAGRN